MAEINDLPPVYRIQPGLPGSAPGKGKKSPRQKPAVHAPKQKDRRKPRPDDEENHVDEYV